MFFDFRFPFFYFFEPAAQLIIHTEDELMCVSIISGNGLCLILGSQRWTGTRLHVVVGVSSNTFRQRQPVSSPAFQVTEHRFATYYMEYRH